MPLTILLHSSKTMVETPTEAPLTTPRFMKEAAELRKYVQTLSDTDLKKSMHISEKLSGAVKSLFDDWKTTGLSAAAECFRGDIYSGLRALDFSADERSFAQEHLYILSGMYGLLRPYDAVSPYRLEAGYRFPDEPYRNIYSFWAEKIAAQLPSEGPVINVTSAEYDTLVMPYIDSDRVITPRFLTIMPGKTEPKFVAVHAKIARGAYARWLIQRGREAADSLQEFTELGYVYDAEASTQHQPVYICRDFQGIGLSQRLA